MKKYIALLLILAWGIPVKGGTNVPINYNLTNGNVNPAPPGLNYNLPSGTQVNGAAIGSTYTGTLSVAHGGTGTTTLTSGAILVGNGTGAVNPTTTGSGVVTAVGNGVNTAGGFPTVNGNLAMNVAPAGSAIVVIGDSRDAGFPVNTLAGSPPQYAVSYTGPGKCWPQWLSAQPFCTVNNIPVYDYGIGGATTATGTAVLATSTPYTEYLNGAVVGNYAGASGPSSLVSALRPTGAGTVYYTIVGGGINDCSNITAGAETFATYKTNMASMFSTLRGYGSNVKVCAVTFPFGNYSVATYSPSVAEEMNQWLRAQSYVDTNSTNNATWDVLIEEASLFNSTITGAGPTSSSGTYTQTSIWYDGLHMNSNGYRLYAQQVAATLGNPNYNVLPLTSSISGASDASGNASANFISRILYDLNGTSVIDYGRGQQVYIDGYVSGAANDAGLIVSGYAVTDAQQLEVHGTSTTKARSAIEFSENNSNTYTKSWEIGVDSSSNGTQDFYIYCDSGTTQAIDFGPGGTATISNGLLTTGKGVTNTGTITNTGPIAETGTETITSGNVVFASIGNTVYIKGGSNAASGTVTLVAGTGTITSTAITANDVVLVGLKTAGGTETFSPLVTVSTGTAVFNANALDTGTYNWAVIHCNQ